MSATVKITAPKQARHPFSGGNVRVVSLEPFTHGCEQDMTISDITEWGLTTDENVRMRVILQHVLAQMNDPKVTEIRILKGESLL